MLAKLEIDYMQDFDHTATTPSPKADAEADKMDADEYVEALGLLRDSLHLLQQAHRNLMRCQRTCCLNRIQWDRTNEGGN